MNEVQREKEAIMYIILSLLHVYKLIQVSCHNRVIQEERDHLAPREIQDLTYVVSLHAMILCYTMY